MRLICSMIFMAVAILVGQNAFTQDINIPLVETFEGKGPLNIRYGEVYLNGYELQSIEVLRILKVDKNARNRYLAARSLEILSRGSELFSAAVLAYAVFYTGPADELYWLQLGVGTAGLFGSFQLYNWAKKMQLQAVRQYNRNFQNTDQEIIRPNLIEL